jgi:cyclin A
MDPWTFDLNQPAMEFDDAYLPTISALPPHPPVRFAPTLVHHAAAIHDHDSIELPATGELYDAALDAHLFNAAVEVPVTYSKNSATRPPLSDYHADIDANLREMEKNANQRPSPDYLKTVQGDWMRKSTRADLVSWMNEFTRYFDLAPGTLHRAVSYVDRFLSQRTVPRNELHILGATAVYTAAKYEEQCTRFKVNATAIAENCGLDVTWKEVIDMESSMVSRTVTWEARQQRLHRLRLHRQDRLSRRRLGLEGEIVSAGPILATPAARAHQDARQPIRSLKKGTHPSG